MSHRYQHIRNIRDLDDELLRLKLRKQIIRNELSLNVEAAKEQLLSANFLMKGILQLFSLRKEKYERPPDKLDQAGTYVHWLSNILDFLNSLRR
jgi:hypothetical protein